jgi:hypothetical protein
MKCDRLPPPRFLGSPNTLCLEVLLRGVRFSTTVLPHNTCTGTRTGVRAGLYPVGNDRRSCYWFTTFNAAEDAAVPSGAEERLQEALGLVR